jgi:hypothetical protein
MVSIKYAVPAMQAGIKVNCDELKVIVKSVKVLGFTMLSIV